MRWVAPTERDDANHALEKRLWDAADQFRANSGLKAGQYSTPVLGLIFLRFAEGRREHLSEEELTVFDILTRPGPKLTTEERDEVKKVARQLLERLNALLVLGWRQKVQARAGVRLAIEDALDEGLPRAYTKETYQAKCNVLFEHVYESYVGDGRSVYRDAV
jgi:type I restriction-modification system DNA methylase subunit